MGKTDYLMAAIRLGLFAIVFFILFIVFLVKSIKRGNQIRNLEKQLKELQDPMKQGQQFYMPMVPPLMQQPYQQPVQTTVQKPLEQQFTPPVQEPIQPVTPPVQDPIQQQVTQPFQQPMQPVQMPVQPYQPTQPEMQYPAAAPAPVFQAAPAPSTEEVDRTGWAPTPSWATPASADPNSSKPLATYTRNEPVKRPREKFFSSINITFGIGVLLLTIVGATFMTGSWSWMTEEVRAISLVILVFLVYGMSFLAGKVLKLQQTGFAMYSLASLLGPIVVVGMGTFNLLGSGFSFRNGTGWLVATVASLVLLVSAVAGRFIFREEKAQSNIYQGTSYISLTWLVVFLSAQIGQASEVVNEWSMICLGLSTVAIAFRILDMTKIFEEEKFFKIYSEVILYIPAVFLLFSFALSDGAIFGASIVEFAALVLFAKFAKGREWAKFLTPFAGLLIAVDWCVFEGGDEMYVLTAVTMVIIFVIFVVHKVFGISSGVSEIGLPVSLGVITSFLAAEEIPGMGAAACFITLAIFIFQMAVEPVLAENGSLPEGIFKGAKKDETKIALSILSAVFYYIGAFMIFLSIEQWPLKGHLYFTLCALIPAAVSIFLRIFWKDDIRIRMAGFVLSITASVSAAFSCMTFEGSSSSVMFYRTDICAWFFTLAVMVMSVFFMVKPLKEKKSLPGAMLWASIFLNSLSLGVFAYIEFLEGNSRVVYEFQADKYTTIRQIASVCFLGLNVIALAVSFFIKRKAKGILLEFAKNIKYFLCGFASSWFIVSWILVGTNWKMLIISVVFAVLLIVLDAEFFSALPVIAAEFSIIIEIQQFNNADIINVLCIAAALLIAGLGRLIFRKEVFSAKAIDYLSLTSVICFLGLRGTDYIAMMIFLTLSLLVINLAKRVKASVRSLVSIFAALVCLAVVTQPFIDYPDIISFEINLLLMLGTLLLICKVIKPCNAVALKYLWFTGVALCITAEGISAAVTSETFDLILVGTASFAIFIYAFIRRNRLWFVLGIISMISIAVYLSLAFWSSLVWLIYLFVAGSILVVMAAINEWGKRHNKDGKKKRFFEEWTW